MKKLLLFLVLLFTPYFVFAETTNYYFYTNGKVYNLRNSIKGFSTSESFENGVFITKKDNKFQVITQESTTFKQDLSILKKKISKSQLETLKKLYLDSINSDFYKIILQDLLPIKTFDKLKQEKELKKNFLTLSGTRPVLGENFFSREKWGANELYGKSEYYLKTCLSGNCWAGKDSQRTKTIRENYEKYFSELDIKNKLEKKSNLTEEVQSYYPIEQIIIHHTAGKYTEKLGDSLNEIRQIYKYHSLTLGWGDIGYHYLIDGEGRIFEGNRGGLYSEGVHVVGHNKGTVGISLMTDGFVSEKMYNSLQNLILDLNKTYKLDLTKEISTRCELLDGWCTGNSIIAHKELDNGKPFDPKIDMLKFRNELKKK